MQRGALSWGKGAPYTLDSQRDLSFTQKQAKKNIIHCNEGALKNPMQGYLEITQPLYFHGSQKQLHGFWCLWLKHRYCPLPRDNRQGQIWKDVLKQPWRSGPMKRTLAFGVGLQDPRIKPEVYPLLYLPLRFVLWVRRKFTLKQERCKSCLLWLADSGWLFAE